MTSNGEMRPLVCQTDWSGSQVMCNVMLLYGCGWSFPIFTGLKSIF